MHDCSIVLSVYPAGSVINVTLLSSRQQESITFTPIVLKKLYEIFGLNVVLESIGAEAVWSCHIFFVGSNSEIVAITGGTRSAIVMIMIIYIVTSCSHPV